MSAMWKLGPASLLAFVAAAACSGDRDPLPKNEAFAPPVDAAPPCNLRRCSRDLRSVIDACDDRGRVVEACTDDQGCGDGACVPACDAAKLSKGSVGCAFYTLPADDEKYGRGSCFVAMIANTWSRPITIRAGLGADPLDISKSVYVADRSNGGTTYRPIDGAVPVGQVALVFLSQANREPSDTFTACPAGVVPALTEDPIRHGTAMTRAFRLETDAPVAAYSIFPYGGADSFYPTATLLRPVSSWDKAYVAVMPAAITAAGAPSPAMRTLQVVAQEDDTEVAIRPRVGIAPGFDVAPAVAGTTQTWKLARGQVLQLVQHDDLASSPIEATKPVAVFGGSTCTNLPGEAPYCDLLQQQIAPLSQWGHEYALVPYLPRIESLTGKARETVPFSVVGAVDGTVLTYDPSRPQGAPERIDAGQVASFFSDGALVVRSQDAEHPFHASVYMTSSDWNGGLYEPPDPFGNGGGGRIIGDPDFVTLVPSDQFLDRYVFFADYTFPETSLTVVRKKTTEGFRAVDLACAGEVTGWQPLGSSGEYEYAWVKLTRGGQPQSFASGTCGYGRHEAKSEGPFSVTIWGTGRDASYGYAGGAGSRPVNAVRVNVY